MKKIDSKKENTNQSKKTLKEKRNISHHSKNYLVLFIFQDVAKRKALVNAKDEKNAIRISLNRFCRLFPSEPLTGVRIGAVYENKKTVVKKRIG